MQTLGRTVFQDSLSESKKGNRDASLDFLVAGAGFEPATFGLLAQTLTAGTKHLHVAYWAQILSND